MRAGMLDRRIELRHVANTGQDTNGAYTVAYIPYTSIAARKEEIGGREYFAAQTKQAENTVRFTIRYRSDVLLTDRLVCEGTEYDITAKSEQGRRVALILFTRAVVP